MNVSLVFNPAKLPRSMTRAQWKEAYRWLRIVSRQIRERVTDDFVHALYFGNAPR